MAQELFISSTEELKTPKPPKRAYAKKYKL
jgi:hypothetical protein